jgi:hypothetical protein
MKNSAGSEATGLIGRSEAQDDVCGQGGGGGQSPAKVSDFAQMSLFLKVVCFFARQSVFVGWLSRFIQRGSRAANSRERVRETAVFGIST